MPREVRERSTSIAPSLRSSFNLSNSDNTGNTNTRSNTPINIFTQPSTNDDVTRAHTTNNTTQPFLVDCDNDCDNDNINDTNIGGINRNNQQQQQHTTTTYRRRQRRTQPQLQQQYGSKHRNRFEVLNQDYNFTGNEPDNIYWNTSPICNNNNSSKQSKQKVPTYLQSTKILRYMHDNANPIVKSRGNQAYTIAATSIYDTWVRDNYELQVWQEYLKMGTHNKHWCKDIVKRTKKRDDLVNSRFAQKKIDQLTSNIAHANATITDLQIQLNTYWSQTSATLSMNSNNNNNPVRLRETVDRLEHIILDYINQNTKHAKVSAEKKIKVAKTEMNEYEALLAFKTAATPLQWDIHLTLKTKVKKCQTKAKNFQIATKRVEYNIPPNFISKTDLTFKVDESILNAEESQTIYNDMRKIVSNYQTNAMSLYLKTLAREKEILTDEIYQIIGGFPKEDEETENGFILYKRYHDIRSLRYEIEAEQASSFLEELRVDEETIIETNIASSTLIRQLGGETFVLRP